MQRVCSMRECCPADIRTKLKRYKLDLAKTDMLIKSLEEDGFIDTRRYAFAFVRDKSSLSGWGPAKIRWTLKSKFIEKELIEEALAAITPEQGEERLATLLGKRLSVLKKRVAYTAGREEREVERRDMEKLKASLVRFALSRGFEYDKVLTQINRLLANFAKH
jgi:regulatory protein